MNQRIRLRQELFIREDQYNKDNQTDFPPGSVAHEQFAEIAAVITLINEISAHQAIRFGDARFGFGNKATAREHLREHITEIGEIVPSMAYKIPGIDVKFRVPRNLTDAEMLALGRAFYADSAAYEADFVRFELDADFRAQLLDALEEFEASLGAPITAHEAQVAATAELGAAIRRGMIAHRILKGLLRQKYRRNPGKLAAWLSASHLEKLPKRDKPVNPPTT
jgi:hypothetical protein